MKITVVADHSEQVQRAKKLAEQYQLPFADSPFTLTSEHWMLIVSADACILHALFEQRSCTLKIDFTQGKMAFRRKQGGGLSQAISRACGLHKRPEPSILDANAGLGRDGFILASLKAKVTMLERCPILAALLDQAIIKLRQLEPYIELNILHCDAKNYLASLQQNAFDIVYLDPMFPAKQKSAQVKQELRLLRALVGDDGDAHDLLPLALTVAKHRVVVKRHKSAPHLNNKTPDFSYVGESTRFDVYHPTKNLPA